MVSRGKFGALGRMAGLSGLAVFASLSAACAAPTSTPPPTVVIAAPRNSTLLVPPRATALPTAVAPVPANPANPRTLRVATLAPKNSPWARGLTLWKLTLERKTNGWLTMEFLYNGVAGPERHAMGKVKAGELEAVMLSDLGLLAVSKAAGVLALPGIATEWAQLDQVRQVVEPELDAAFQSAGFRRIGWGDLGRVRLFTRGFAARHPRHLVGRSVHGRSSGMYGCHAIQLTATGIRAPSQNVDACYTTALAFMQSQLVRFDHVCDDAIAGTSGTMLFDSQTLARMPTDLRQILEDTGARLGSALRARIRRDDDQAYQELAQTMTVVTRTPAERAAWDARYRTTIVSVVQRGALDKALVNKALQARGLALIP